MFSTILATLHVLIHLIIIFSLVAQMVKDPPDGNGWELMAMWETWVQSLGWEDTLEEGR